MNSICMLSISRQRVRLSAEKRVPTLSLKNLTDGDEEKANTKFANPPKSEDQPGGNAYIFTSFY